MSDPNEELFRRISRAHLPLPPGTDAWRHSGAVAARRGGGGWGRAAAGLGAMAATAAAVLAVAGHRPTAPPGPTAPAVAVPYASPGPAGPIQLGATLSQLPALEAATGARLTIARSGYYWHDQVAGSAERAASAAGRTVMIGWRMVDSSHQETTFSDVAAGRDDAYITAQLTALQQLGGPVMLNFSEEASLPGTGGCGRDAYDACLPHYLAAWHRLHGLAVQLHATNVQLVWSVTTSAFDPQSDRAQEMYPGDAEVAWVGVTAQNEGGCGGTGWDDFAASGPALAGGWIHSHAPAKRLVVIHGGTPEDAHETGRKAAWIGGMESAAGTAPLDVLGAVVWWEGTFNRSGATCDEHVATSPQSLSAFRHLAHDPRFGGDGKP
jgi:hypothetical protein